MKTNPIKPAPGTNLHPLNPVKTSRFQTFTALALMAILCLTAQMSRASTSLVIAEVYGGGGNNGATLKNDFVVLFNPTDSPVVMTDWSVQYASGGGTTWAVSPFSGTVPAGGYFLVQQAAGAGGTVDLPTPDATGSLAMSGTSGKVALCNVTNALTDNSPNGSTVVDYVGYGSSANAYEGSGPTPTLSNSTSAQRKNGGCQDTDNNASDFVTGAPNPRNSSSPAQLCGGDLSITAQPQSRTNNAGTSATFSVSANGATGFQWSKQGVGSLSNGDKYTGADTTTLTVRAVLKDDEGQYFVTVQGASTSSNSQNASLTVVDPVISTQPANAVNVAGDIVDLYATVVGTSPVHFWWYKDDVSVPIGLATVNDPTNVISANLINSQPDDQGDYFLVASNAFGVVTSSVATVTIFPTPSTRIARWNFNFNSTTPSEGAGSLSFLAVPTVNFFAGSFSDPAQEDAPLFNVGLSTAGYPTTSTSNKLAGVQFNVGTSGYKNILLTWNQRHSATASKYVRVQYSADGFTSTTNDHTVIVMLDTNLNYVFYSSDLSGISSVNDNPNFAFRLVTEFEDSATGSGVNGYVGTASTYGTGGTIRYDLMSVYGSTLAEVTPIPLVIERSGNNVVLSWSDPVFSLQAAPFVTGIYTNISGAQSPYPYPISGGATYFRLINE